MSAPSNCCSPCCSDQELIEIPGIQGIPGTDGADGAEGIGAFTTLGSDLTIPAVGSTTAAVTVVENSWMAIGQAVFISDGTDMGTFTVATKTGTTAATFTFLGVYGDSAVGAVINSGAVVSPAGVVVNQSQAGAGSPEGAVYGSPGKTWLNTTDESVWIKKTGTNTNTGWISVIAALMLLFCTMASYAAPPIVRTSLTTNLQAAALGLVTNISGTLSTNANTLTVNTNLAGAMSTNVYTLVVMTNIATALDNAVITAAGGSLNVSTGVVTTAAAAATNILTAYNYSKTFGTVGVETNTSFVVTNAGTYVLSFGSFLTGANTDVIRMEVFTNAVFCSIAELSFTATASVSSETGFKQFALDLPALARVQLRYGSQNASAIGAGNVCFNIRGAH